MSFGSIGSLAELREFFMVLRGLNEEEIFFLLTKWGIIYLVPLINERWTLEIGSTGAVLTLGPLHALWKALRLWVLLYPLFLKTSRRWDFSFSRWISLEILRARVARVLRTPNFWAGKWWELAWRYCLVWVFFVKNSVRNGTIIHPREENVKERKASILVNFHCEVDGFWFGIKVVYKKSNFSRPWDQMMQVPSTNLFHFLEWNWAEANALVSKYSINKLATIGEGGEPITTLQVFS